ncbi:MAG: hypothetical protein DDT39_01666 [Firmicutes bacterium]|nr:hypothetical protein [candidate division NPL-UPA2 bacterium]
MEDVYWWQYVVGILYILVQITALFYIVVAAIWIGWRVLNRVLFARQSKSEAPTWVLLRWLVFAICVFGVVTLLESGLLEFLGITGEQRIAWLDWESATVVLGGMAGLGIGWLAFNRILSAREKELNVPAWVHMAAISIALPLFLLPQVFAFFLVVTETLYIIAELSGIAIDAAAAFIGSFVLVGVSICWYKFFYKFIQKNGNEQQGAPTPAQLEP